jgi:hypothetical protein
MLHPNGVSVDRGNAQSRLASAEMEPVRLSPGVIVCGILFRPTFDSDRRKLSAEFSALGPWPDCD